MYVYISIFFIVFNKDVNDVMHCDLMLFNGI